MTGDADHLAGDLTGSTGPTGPSDDAGDASRRLRRLQIDLDTLVEATQQINLRSLDLERLERYAASLLMGQFGVLEVAVLRRPAFESEGIGPTLVRNLELPSSLELPLDSPLIRYLQARAAPLPVAEVAEAGEAGEVLAEAGVDLIVPLIKRDIEGSRELVGVLCLGPRASGASFSEAEMRLLGLVADMLAISLHNARLHHRSIFDSLTKVYSRGHFDLHLAQEFDRTSRRREAPQNPQAAKCLALLMVDIDHFKEFNDEYGHPTGDEVLRTIARAVRGATRSGDAVARYGGEEFCIILPETEVETARMVADRIRERVAACDLGDEVPDDVELTVSVGVAGYPFHAADETALVREADKALYAAKEAGRNRVVVADEAPEPDEDDDEEDA